MSEWPIPNYSNNWEKHMKSEDHIRFLSDLLSVIEELQTLVRDYCREMTEDEEKSYWRREKYHHEKVPF
jgi:hypothetical protein